MCDTAESTINADIENIIPEPRDLLGDEKTVQLMERVVYDLVQEQIASEEDMKKFVRRSQKTYHIVISNIQLLYYYRLMVNAKKIVRNKQTELFMKSKSARTQSGVTVVTIMTSPWPATAEKEYGQKGVYVGDLDTFSKDEKTLELAKKYKHFSCKYDCWFCPSEPGQARSYLMKEPAVARANQNRFSAIEQFRDRGHSYTANGLPFDKIELIVIGGTWHSYDLDYRNEFVRDTYYAANTYYDKDYLTKPREKLSLDAEIKINETSACRIIGLTIETRPDQITRQALVDLRLQGVTRVQLGVQHTDNEILKYINRRCTTEDAMRAIKLLKENCFKVDIHLMPDLPNSSPEKDKQMLDHILTSEDLQADQMKLYMTSVVPWTKIKIWNDNEKRNYDTVTNPDGLSSVDNRRYKPYAEDKILTKTIKVGKTEIYSSPLIELLIDFKSKVHPWIRLNRVVRDIPNLYITGGNDREDLRCIIQSEMKKRGLRCNCIRCREVKNKKTDIENAKLVVRTYKASGGTEHFLSYESPDRQIIYGFLRLRLNPKTVNDVFPELMDTALIRELHVYGNVVPINKKIDEKMTAQHMGFGKKLMKKAEQIAIDNGFYRIAVISGVGVRPYYRKLGYTDEGHFQIKHLTKTTHNMVYYLMLFVLVNVWLIYYLLL